MNNPSPVIADGLKVFFFILLFRSSVLNDIFHINSVWIGLCSTTENVIIKMLMVNLSLKIPRTK